MLKKIDQQLYMDQTVHLKLDQAETRRSKFGSGVRQGCCLSPILFNFYSEYFTKETLEGLGDFKIGEIILTVKYAGDLM
jgi:hypothetical protein